MPLLLGAALFFSPGPVAAAPTRIGMPGFEYPWSAVGRLNVAGHGYCSAVMVSERHLLTAAHCLWLASENRWWPAEAMHFVPGFQGDITLFADVRRYWVADGYGYGHGDAEGWSRDWAILELDRPLGRETGWLAAGGAGAGTVAAGDSLVTVGYGQDHRYRAGIDLGCRILSGPPRSPLIWTDCEALRGGSGGPLLAVTDAGVKVIGVVAGSSARGQGGGMAGVVPLSSMADSRRFPMAAKIVTAFPERGKAPPAGGTVPAEPLETMRVLGDAGDVPAGLARLLGRVGRDGVTRP